MNPAADYNIFTYLTSEQHSEVSHSVASGALAGMRFGIKDNIAVQDMPLTCASRILEEYISPYTATAVERLEAAGGNILGKTNLDEFAMGSSSEYSIHGPVHNPLNPEYVAGGSSGGSAAAVAAQLVDAALGSDTGGSVRQPASFCGVVGMKPTYGRISRYGLVAFASSLDQIGVFTADVGTNARVLGTIAGHDPQDATSVAVPVPDYTSKLAVDPGKFTAGIPNEYFDEGLNPEVRERIMAVISELEKMGVTIKAVSLPHTPYAVAMYYIISSAEASSNLARYDGVRYGLRLPNEDLQQMYTETRAAGFGPEVKRRIMLGTYVLSAGYYDAYYGKAQRVRRLLSEDFKTVFNEVDVLITPTTPTTAFKLGSKLEDPLTMYLNDIYTVSINLAGLPAMSVPVGTDKTGLPIGCQIVAPAFQEETIYQIGTIIERFDWT
jgi:aspartyl-tRNA(Asn)/glutamyl-tRNA(Gln) amidotransferase subunit A